MKKTMHQRKKKIWLSLILVLLLLAGGVFLYVQQYYHAEESARSALVSDEIVTVARTENGWLFDGPSQRDALIFYPGGKVEETAYAPLLHLLAREGMDAFLVKMPFRLAVFGADRANALIDQYEYENWYIGGHSLGGAMAANYAAGHAEQLAGVILLAAYPTKRIEKDMMGITIYGSEDGILNPDKLKKGDQYMPEHSVKYVIEGGNHAQFGNYGKQKGDGEASVSDVKQQQETVEIILQNTS